MRNRLGRQAIDLAHLSVMPQPEHHELIVACVFPNSDNFITRALLGSYYLGTAGVDQTDRQLVVWEMTGISESDRIHSVERIAASHESNTEASEK